MNVRSEHATDDITFLERRKLRHDDNALVSLRSADHGDSDAGVSASILDDCHSRLEGSRSLRVLEHALRDSILDGSAGILHLELDEDAGIVCFRFGGEDSAHPYQGRLADGVDYARVRHGSSLFKFNGKQDYATMAMG